MYRDDYERLSILENRPTIGQPRGLPLQGIHPNVGAGPR